MRGGTGEAEWALQTQASWFTKVHKVQLTQTHFISHSKGRHLHPMVELPSPTGRPFPCPFGADPQVPQAAPGSGVWPSPWIPYSRGMEMGSAKASWTIPVRNLQEESSSSFRTEGFTLLTNLLLCGWGTEAAAQFTVGRDWMQVLISRSVAAIQDSLVFTMLFS